MRQVFVTGVYAFGLKHVLHVAVSGRWHRDVFKISQVMGNVNKNIHALNCTVLQLFLTRKPENDAVYLSEHPGGLENTTTTR